VQTAVPLGQAGYGFWTAKASPASLGAAWVEKD
jgi:hypothetical protein